MLPSRINTNKCLKPERYSIKEFDQIETINDFELLKSALIKCCQTNEQKKAIRRHLQKHFGPESGLDEQALAQLKKYLSCMIAALSGQVECIRLTEDEKYTIMDTIALNIKRCGNGFRNRVYMIIGSFNQPKTIDELLCAYRLQIVGKAYNKVKALRRELDANQDEELNEIHVHHRFHVLANTLGFGIPYEELRDKYAGNVPDPIIEKNLQAAFQEFYTPEQIVTHIWEQACLHQLGYRGQYDYKLEAYELLLGYFRQVFANSQLIYRECFIMDEMSAIKDIDWIAINSRLIRYLEDNEYFLPFAAPKTIICKFNQDTLTLTYSGKDFTAGVLEYVTGKSKYYGFLNADEHALLSIIPKELADQLKIKMASPEPCPPIYIYEDYMQRPGFERCVENIHSSKDLVHYFNLIQPKQYRVLCAAMSDKLLGMINGERNFFKALTQDQCSAVIDTIKDKLPEMVKRAHGFKSFLRKFNPDQYNIVCMALKDSLPEMVRRGHGLGHFLRRCKKQQSSAVINALKDSLPAMIENELGLSRFFSHSNLKKDQGCAVVKAIKDKLPGCMLVSPPDFHCAMKYLTAVDRSHLFQKMRGMLPGKIHVLEDVERVMQYLTLEERKVIYDGVKDRIPVWIHYAHHIPKVLNFLTPDQGREFCQAIKGKLPGMMRSLDNFVALIYSLVPGQFRVVGEFIQQCAFSESFITTRSQLNRVFEIFKPDESKKLDFFNHGLTGFSPEEADHIATAFRHIYLALRASLKGPGLFKPGHAFLNQMDKLSNQELFFTAFILYKRQHVVDSLIWEAWELAITHANGYRSDDPLLLKSICQWSRSHSSFFRPSVVRDERVVKEPGHQRIVSVLA